MDGHAVFADERVAPGDHAGQGARPGFMGLRRGRAGGCSCARCAKHPELAGALAGLDRECQFLRRAILCVEHVIWREWSVGKGSMHLHNHLLTAMAAHSATHQRLLKPKLQSHAVQPNAKLIQCPLEVRHEPRADDPVQNDIPSIPCERCGRGRSSSNDGSVLFVGSRSIW